MKWERKGDYRLIECGLNRLEVYHISMACVIQCIENRVRNSVDSV